MTLDVLGDREWITLQEASRITGKRASSLRAAIQRGKYDRIKKRRNKKGEYWLIHKDELAKEIGDPDRGTDGSRSTGSEADRDHEIAEKVDGNGHRQDIGDLLGDRVIAIPVEYYEQQQKEHDNLLQGLMMYRYKFEELDRQVKLLPAPPDIIAKDFQQKVEALQLQEEKVKELEDDRHQKAQALTQAQKILQQAQEVKDRYKASIVDLKAKLAEEERAREAYKIQWELAQAELNKPWWKKLFGMK
jgi:hypothetical protein